LAIAALLALPVPALAGSGKFALTIVDGETGEQVPCRVHLKSPNGKPRKVGKLPFWHDHIVCPGKLDLELPRGTYTFEIERGPEYAYYSGHFTIENFADDARTIELKRYVNMADEGWWPGELHVHRPLDDIELLMRAEDLHVAPVITWWNDRSEWEKRKPPAELLVRFDKDRYYHFMAGEDEREGGALLYFNLPRPLAIAGASREYPSPMKFLEEARRFPGAHVDIEKPFWWDVPVWLASGQVDSIGLANNHMFRGGMYERGEAWGKPRDKKRYLDPWGNGEWSQAIYHHILNCGLRIPPSAGSASGVLPNPVGYNRVYVYCGQDFSYDKWWEGLRAGRVMVTNGPMLRPVVNGEYYPGHVFEGQAGEELEFEIALNLATRDKINYLEIIKNGEVERSVRLDEYARTGQLPRITFTASGWFLVRAVCDLENTYRFASTGPYYVEFDEEPRISKASAQFFFDWVNERIDRVKLDDPDQRREVLEYHESARAYWEDVTQRANAE
jgi:hypothetical protein